MIKLINKKKKKIFSVLFISKNIKDIEMCIYNV